VENPYGDLEVGGRSPSYYVGVFQNLQKITFLPYWICRKPMDPMVFI